MGEKRTAASGYTGVEVRGDSVRIRVPFGGQWVWEKLETSSSPQGLKEAARLRQQIIDRDRLGEVDWPEFFPDSSRSSEFYEVIPTFAECSKKYLHFCEFSDGKSPSTLLGYRKRLEGIWCPVFGDRDIDRISKPDIQNVIASRKWSSGSTMRNALTPLRGVFDLAVEDNLISISPANGIKAHRSQTEKPDPLNEQEMRSVLSVIPGEWRSYFEVALGTGMRSSELVGLKWANVDLERGSVFVCEARVEGVDKDTKNHKSRTLPLMPLARKGFISQCHDRSPYVFLKPETSEPLDNDRRQHKVWQQALREAGVRHRKAYATRHTFATLLLRAGESIENIAAWLGHGSPQVTYDHYAAWIDASRTEPLEASLKILRA